MKEAMKSLPPIDAQFEHRPDPEYASELLDRLLRYYTLDQISLHTGISRRSVSYLRHKGFHTMSDQLIMEVLAGVRSLTTDG